MPPDDSTTSTESMALLGQFQRLLNPAAPVWAAALTRKSGQYSSRMELVLSQCQNEDDVDHEMWDDFEIHRRSANTYLNQYLDCQELVNSQRSRHVYEIDDFHGEALATDVVARESDSSTAGKTREEWRLKISHDSLQRDLLAMLETLQFLKERPAHLPRGVAFPTSAWASFAATGICLVKFQTVEALAAFVASSGAVCYCWSETRKYLRLNSIQRWQEKIEGLVQRLNRGELYDIHRGDLERWIIVMVDHFRE